MSDIAVHESLRDANAVARMVLRLNSAHSAAAISDEGSQAMIRATPAGKPFGEHHDETPPNIEED